MLVFARSMLLLSSLLFVDISAAANSKAILSAPVRCSKSNNLQEAEGVVEAIRQSEVAAQVSGIVTNVTVLAGDQVTQGQILARIDARAAEQEAAAAQAKAEAANAELTIAKKEFERSLQLFKKRFVSASAMDQADARLKAAQAQAQALHAIAVSAHTQLGFYTLRAPYTGTISDVPAHPGEMALPGRVIATIYDPHALRVTASVPQTSVGLLIQHIPTRIEFPSLPENQRFITLNGMTILPTTDTHTQTVQLRFDLPANTSLKPGVFARVWLPMSNGYYKRLYVPNEAIFRRSEMQLVYVIDQNGKAQLRQVRTGSESGGETEILSGVREGERVALDPLSALRVK